MDPVTARIVILGVAALGWAAWLVSVILALRLVKRPEKDYRRATAADVAGTVRVPGRAVTLSRLLTDRIASMAIGPMGAQCKIAESTAERVRVEMPATVYNLRGTAQSMPYLNVDVSFRDAGENVEVSYEADMLKLRKKMGKIALGINALGLLAIAVLPAGLYLYVASHHNPEVRWQSVQVVQMVHFLWPPYLFLGMYWRAKRLVATALETLVTNLQYGAGAR
jgi:hypothetical protein